MNLLHQKLKDIRSRKIRLMTHVVIGYPSLNETIQLAKIMVKSGVDFIELQIPFSDPLADGPTIMKACEKSLEQGIKIKDAFTIMKKLKIEVKVPLLFMCYYNMVFNYGTKKFLRDAKEAGCFGLIVPDMPIDEENEEHYFKYCKQYGLNPIIVLSPNTTDERMKKLSSFASGFVYVTTRQGTTGVSAELNPNLVKNLERVREYFKIPIAVGFGISKKEHIRQLQNHADIAVVGSAIINVINKSDKLNMNENVSNFIKDLKMVE